MFPVEHPASSTKYEPLTFTALIGGGMISGFVDGVVGMKENETKSFTVLPADGYGSYYPEFVFTTSRQYDMDMIEVVPISFFDDKDIEIENGSSFQLDIGTVFIDGFNDTHANLTYVFKVGDIFYYAGLPHEVTGSSNYTYTITRDVINGSTYQTLSPVTGQLSYIRVINITDDTITFDENHRLAGKNLDFEVTVVGIKKTAQQ